MAEAVLFNIANAILAKLGTLALQEIGLLWGLQDELEKLKDTVETIKDVLLDAEKQYLTSDAIRVWLDALKDTVYDADDLLDDISTDTLRRKLKSDIVATKGVQLCFSYSNRFPHALKMAYQIRDIRAKLNSIAENKKFHLNLNLIEPTVGSYDRHTHSSTPKIVIGREDAKKNIISLLKADYEETVAVIPIVGLGGLGKTTLAQMVYNDSTVQAQFELKAWVCIFDVFEVKSIVEKMIECIDEEKSTRNLDLKALKNQLCKKISGKKYLLVLDDVWNEDYEKWVQLCDLIIDGARGSRIIITTRNMLVCKIIGTMPPYELKDLSKTESWELFQKVAFQQGQVPNEVFEKLGKDIAAKCGGLPLAIRTIGSLLYTKREVSEWQHFKNEEFSKLDPNSHIVETLKLSYDHLPSNLKHCFAYCSLFPKDYTFDVAKLISYWKAQGYVDAKNEGPFCEDGGLSYFKYLLQRSFFEIEKENEYGEIEKCKMHDFMHDLALLVAGEETKLVYGNCNRTAITRKTRHMSLHEIDIGKERQHLAPLLQRKKVRTLIVEDRYGGELDNMSCRAIVDKLICLRVLEIPRGEFKKLPHFIDRLKHLRQLDISRNPYIDMLPECITRLYNLQVLNLDYCYELKKLPKDIKNLVNLTYLGVEGCWRLEGMPQGIGQLTSLEVLSVFTLSQRNRQLPESIGRLDELHRLNNLKGNLRIVNLEFVKNGTYECEGANLKEKPYLRCLKLVWGDHEVEDVSKEEKLLEGLEPHVNLRELAIISYRGARFPSWISFLEKLIRIEIRCCKNCKSFIRLATMPSLQYVRGYGLQEIEYIIENEGVEWNASTQIFPSLKSLYLEYCPKLKGWWRSMSTMEKPLCYQLPCLSELEIRFCNNMKEWMPLLPSLSTLTLIGTTAELLAVTLKQAKQQTSASTPQAPLQQLDIAYIRDLGILSEETLRNLASLEVLKFQSIAGIGVLTSWLQYLISLKFLSIESSENAMHLFEENNTESIQCPQSLHFLRFSLCTMMKSIPKGVQHLTSLKTLEIIDCSNLESLPEWTTDLTSLNHLYILHCTKLTERCRSKEGENWCFISHIPNIQVDYKWVQRDGRYQL